MDDIELIKEFLRERRELAEKTIKYYTRNKIYPAYWEGVRDTCEAALRAINDGTE